MSVEKRVIMQPENLPKKYGNRSVPLIGKGEKFFEKMKKNGLGGATFFE
ncbi:MAG: hypothetical protein ACOZF2_17805 [Thermodesulfobacteriota bacterium]